MSLALKAAASLLGLPDEVAAQLPELLSNVTSMFADAQQRVTNIENALTRIERKLDVLGAAIIQVMEKQNVYDASTTIGTGNGSNSSTAAGTSGNVA